VSTTLFDWTPALRRRTSGTHVGWRRHPAIKYFDPKALPAPANPADPAWVLQMNCVYEAPENIASYDFMTVEHLNVLPPRTIKDFILRRQLPDAPAPDFAKYSDKESLVEFAQATLVTDVSASILSMLKQIRTPLPSPLPPLTGGGPINLAPAPPRVNPAPPPKHKGSKDSTSTTDVSRFVELFIWVL
jgi:hypothetical protein